MKSILALLVCVGLACSKGGDDSAETSGSGSGSAPEAVEKIEPAVPAVDVTGAYLAACSDETETSYVKENSEDVIACAVLRQDRTVVPTESMSLALLLEDGRRLTPAALPKEVTSPWQAGARITIEEQQALKGVEVTYTEAGKAPVTLITEDIGYPWQNDPSWADISGVIRAFISFIRGPKQVSFDETKVFKQFQDEVGGPFQLIFATDQLYAGDFGGIAAADEICTQAGAALSERKYFAVLSTPDAPFKDRVERTANIFNYPGVNVVPEGGDLFGGKLAIPVYASQSGQVVDRMIPDSDPPDIQLYTWTGTTNLGEAAPLGATCQGWTSADSKARGLVGAAHSAERWAGTSLVRCDRKLRLLCLSESSAAPIKATAP